MDAGVARLVGLRDGAPVAYIRDAVCDDDGEVLYVGPVSPVVVKEVLPRDA